MKLTSQVSVHRIAISHYSVLIQSQSVLVIRDIPISDSAEGNSKIKFFFVQRRIKIYFAQRRNNSSLHKSRGNFRATSSAVIMSSALLSYSLLLTLSPYAPLSIHPLATQLSF